MMVAALIILGVLVAVGFPLWLHDRSVRRRMPSHERKVEDEPEVAEAETPDTAGGDGCCGMHIACEKDSLSTAVGDGVVEYYDDEELDAFRGRGEQDYTDAEIEMFREVLLTLLPHDIAGWARSLQLRGITMPACVRDELLLIVAEAREGVRS